MKKRWAALTLVVCLAFAAAARAEGAFWARDRVVSCPTGRLGCRLLQMCMMNAFQLEDPSDALSLRVLSAAYKQLCGVTDEDMAHFLAEYPEEADEETLLERYYAALANGLRASILNDPLPRQRLSPTRRVLLLFLDPEGEEDPQAQMETIRDELTDELLELFSQDCGAPISFIEWLIFKDISQEEITEGIAGEPSPQP